MWHIVTPIRPYLDRVCSSDFPSAREAYSQYLLVSEFFLLFRQSSTKKISLDRPATLRAGFLEEVIIKKGLSLGADLLVWK